jgi:BolA protein
MSETRTARIEKILEEALKPEVLVVQDDSRRHEGHLGRAGIAPGTGETHYKVRIVSPVFTGLSRIDRQRKVNDLLQAEFQTGLHALSMTCLAPGEKIGGS